MPKGISLLCANFSRAMASRIVSNASDGSV